MREHRLLCNDISNSYENGVQPGSHADNAIVSDASYTNFYSFVLIKYCIVLLSIC